MSAKQPWLGRPIVDISFILLPPFLCLAAIVCFPHVFQNNAEMPDSWWVIMILLIDVAHVYSTLYRTYFNPSLYLKFKSLLTYIPIIAFVSGAVVYSMSDLWFWRLLTYLAVYHFIRQQYGFMKLYSRFENASPWQDLTDKFTIYYATIYPLLFWHLGGKRNFNWFINNDLLYFQSDILLKIATIIYVVMLVVYLGKEIYICVTNQKVNIPKIAIMIGTIVSWYFGIVYYNGDMAFTLLNVVSHGIPYMALIWIFVEKESNEHSGGFLRLFFGQYGLPLFLGLIFLLAYFEEGLWDWAVWKEHEQVFSIFHRAPIHISNTALAIIIPFLTLPQITHYVIDGFIWRKN